MNLYVVTATLNNRAYTERLFTALDAAAKNGVGMRRVVVDNASADDTVDWAAQQSGTQVLANERNIGAAGCGCWCGD